MHNYEQMVLLVINLIILSIFHEEKNQQKNNIDIQIMLKLISNASS